MSSPSNRKQSALEIRKKCIRLALSFMLKALLPVECVAGREPILNTHQGSIVTIQTDKMCLLHAQTKVKARPGVDSLAFFMQSKDLDTQSMGRYIRRCMKPGREIAFRFVFSNDEIAMLENNQTLTDGNKPVTTSYTEFFMILCPLDLMIAPYQRGSAQRLAYNLNTSYKANARIVEYLQSNRTSDECLTRLTRCYFQVGDYRKDLLVAENETTTQGQPASASDPSKSVCQLTMTRESDFMNILINMFCQVTLIYGAESALHGHVFADELESMNKRIRSMPYLIAAQAKHPSVQPPSAASIASSASRSQFAPTVHPRHRVLVLRASLDQLNDDASADAFQNESRLFFDRMRKVKPQGGAADAAAHAENVKHSIESFTKALAFDGFVCGMVNVFVDEQHKALVIIDTYVHPCMARKLFVLDAIRAALADLAADEAVARVAVLAPITMKRDTALPLYDALFGAQAHRDAIFKRTSSGVASDGAPDSGAMAASMEPIAMTGPTLAFGTPVYAEW
jgi:hypothetical protein